MDFQEFKTKLQNRSFPLNFPGHWLSHQWRTLPGEKSLKGSINPSSGEEIIRPSSDRAVFIEALDLAESGQRRLNLMTFEERIELVMSMRQALADYKNDAITCMAIQAGKPTWEALTDFDAAIAYLDAMCKESHNLVESSLNPAKLSVVHGDYSLTPIGTTIAFLPFSTPLTSFVKYFSAALLAGCPLILCPSSHASLSGLLYAYLAENLGLPEGVLSVVFGNFETFKMVLPDKRIKAIIYTGSREHGEMIRRESRANIGRELIVQSGGKNSLLVHSSADLDHAVKCALIGAFKGAGQLCTSTSRIFVHKTLLKDFAEALVATIQSVKIARTDLFEGHEDVFMGPMYSRKAVEKFLRYQTMAHREAEADLLWGKHKDSNIDNCLVSPGLHLMKSFDPSSSYQSNVLFCPDIAMYEYDKLDEAIHMVNTTDAPFCTAFIGDESILRDRQKLFTAPNLLVNMPTVEVENTPALTGRFYSGQHRFNGAGLLYLLSYPQLKRSEPSHSYCLRAWQWN